MYNIYITKNSLINNWKKILLILSLLILIFGNLYFGFYYLEFKKELKIVKNDLVEKQINIKIVNFLNLFIEKVLKADGEVSFEDRLKLENSVRDIDNNEIFIQWENFINSKTELDAQIEVKNLLYLLVNKISK